MGMKAVNSGICEHAVVLLQASSIVSLLSATQPDLANRLSLSPTRVIGCRSTWSDMTA